MIRRSVTFIRVTSSCRWAHLNDRAEGAQNPPGAPVKSSGCFSQPGGEE